MKIVLELILLALVLEAQHIKSAGVTSLQPEAPKLLVADFVTFTCTMTNDSDPNDVMWSMTPDGSASKRNITTLTDRVDITSSGENSTSIQSVLTISQLAQHDSGNYTCDFNQTQMTSVLMVFKEPVAQISSSQSEALITIGQTIVLTCDTNYRESVKWSRDGRDLGSGSGRIVINSNVLTIVASNISDAGTYQCTVDMTSQLGLGERKISSDSITFINNINLTITDDRLRREEGESIRIDCIANGYPLPTITWTKDNERLENSSVNGHFVVTEIIDDRKNEVISTLSLSPLTFEDHGSYRCNATDGHSSAEVKYELYIIDRMAAVWPFIGIMSEVIGLIIIILAVEKYQTGQLACK